MPTTALTAKVIQLMWLVWALCWLAAAWQNKKPRAREPWHTRIRYQLVVTGGIALMMIGVPRDDEMGVMPRGTGLNVVCILLVGLGLGWALYARHHLGRNWSGTVQLKEDHSLIRSGPYRYSRHPIYTGLLLGFIGLGLFFDNLIQIPAIALVVIGFRMKIAREEAFMGDAFGSTYDDYKRHARMLIPYIW